MGGESIRVRNPTHSVDVGVAACLLALCSAAFTVSATRPPDDEFGFGAAPACAVATGVVSVACVVGGLALKRAGWRRLGVDPATVPPPGPTELAPGARVALGLVGMVVSLPIILAGLMTMLEQRVGLLQPRVSYLALILGTGVALASVRAVAEGGFGLRVPLQPAPLPPEVAAAIPHTLQGPTPSAHLLPTAVRSTTGASGASGAVALPLHPPMTGAPVPIAVPPSVIGGTLPLTDTPPRVVPATVVDEGPDAPVRVVLDGTALDTPYAVLRAILEVTGSTRTGIGGFADVAATACDLGRPIAVTWRDAEVSSWRMGASQFELTVRELHAVCHAPRDPGVPGLSYVLG